jgi:purine-binding chemotaxis protein CheW
MAGTNGDVAESRVTHSASPEWVVFGSALHRFGVPIQFVREIIGPRPFTRLPGCGAEVCGLIGLRGRVVTVFDFAAALGLAPIARDGEHRLLLVEHGTRLVGFAVEEVLGVAAGTRDELPLGAEELRGLDIERDDLIGVGELHERPFLALDPKRILDRLLA